MATHSPADPLELAIDIPPLAEARKAFLDHQAKRPRLLNGSLATVAEIKAYDKDLLTWLTTKEKLSLRLELAQAQEIGAWKPCALPDHPCPQPEPVPSPKSQVSSPQPHNPAPATHSPAPSAQRPKEAPMPKGYYPRKNPTPEEKLAHKHQIYLEARTPSSQRNARQAMRMICKLHGLEMPRDVKAHATAKPAPKRTPSHQSPKLSPQALAKVNTTLFPAKAQALSPTAVPYTHELLHTADVAVSRAALLRMRKEGWLLLAAIETMRPTDRGCLVETMEMVRGQLDMALTLAGGAA